LTDYRKTPSFIKYEENTSSKSPFVADTHTHEKLKTDSHK